MNHLNSEIIKQQITYPHMSDRCNEIKKEIDSEIIMLSHIVGELRDEVKEHMRITEEYKSKREADEQYFKERMEPVIRFFDGISFMNKATLWFLGMLVAIAGLVLTIKKLLE